MLADAGSPRRGSTGSCPTGTVPSRVRAFATTRRGGVSAGARATMNLGRNVGDDDCRARRKSAPSRVLSSRAADVARPGSRRRRSPCSPRASAACAESGRRRRGHARSRRRLRGPHRRLPAGAASPIGAATRSASRMPAGAGSPRACSKRRSRRSAISASRPDDLVAWLGPAIGPAASKSAPTCAIASARTIPPPTAELRAAASRQVARRSLWPRASAPRARGVRRVSGGGHCTHSDAARFFSYRRERDTGRMATAIWLARD